MHLKKIVISGFKSFADKIVISLDTGISGVVGPNGSGKSNVIDAVRWVMGEQNAKNLRGEKATDIIFAGSERRKPLGMAEVSLVFDNSAVSSFCPPEYRHETEITLTRRMYADGQREYEINRKNCRLKDIVEFFAMTGLGGRSYSMIQQGQVERILNAKPEDVREILEEAAGTTIFKKRRDQAQKKLEQTHVNLSRIDDILMEVERQLEALTAQVEKAKRYKELSEKLREDEMSLLSHNYRHFKTKLDDLRKIVEEHVNKELEMMREAASFEARHNDLQAQLDEADPDMQALQEKISVIREKIARAESLLKSSADKLDYGEKRLKELAEELSEDDANLKVLESQVEASRTEVDSADRVARELQESIANFEHEVESAQEAAQVYAGRKEEFEDEVRNLERLIENNKYRFETQTSEREKNTARRDELQARLSTLQSELTIAQEELTVAERNAGEKKSGLDQEIREKHDREAAIAQSYTRLKEANASRDTLRERYHEARARHTSLEELIADATDVAASVHRLKEHDPELGHRMIGLLTDYIGLGEEADELPVRARSTFEKWAERLLLPDLDSLNEIVRSAQKADCGALPISLIKAGRRPDSATVQQWCDRWGAEPLKPYLKVERSTDGLDDLLDRIYLLPTLSLETEAAASRPEGLIVFTSQGLLFAAQDEFLVGGRAGAGILSRKTELAELGAELKEIEGRLAASQAEIDNLDARINEDRQIVADIDSRLQQQNQDVLEVMSTLQSAQQVFDTKSELIESTDRETTQLSEAVEQATTELATLEENRQGLEQELESARVELNRIDEESSSLLDRREELRRQHEGKKVELAKSEARAQALRDSFLTTKAQLELLQNKLSRRYEERSRLEQEIDESRVHQTQSRADIESFVHERETLEGEFAEKREENAGLLEEIRVLDNKLRDFREEQANSQRIVNDKKVQIERLTVAIEGVTEQATEKYHVELDGYEFEEDPNFNAENKQRTVSRTRNKIEELGDINMMALTEFEEKSERRDFIVRQRDEVLSSIDLLEAAIGEIEETSERKFLDTYETINREFGELFPILFPTGEGNLELTNAEDPLNAGIEIMCRLPGKSRKPMSLFSGGEKALTAMALIFALLRTKPTPFCFLDEVDAPLDEANVGRYNNVLQALSDQFQFVVITHNRRTMEVLDTLYGVTMQEPGVSKVVGVDLKKDIPPHLRKAFKEQKQRPVEGASTH